MSAAGGGHLGADGNAALSAAAVPWILVLGECLVDLAPSSPAPKGAKSSGTATPPDTAAASNSR